MLYMVSLGLTCIASAALVVFIAMQDPKDDGNVITGHAGAMQGTKKWKKTRAKKLQKLTAILAAVLGILAILLRAGLLQ